MHLHARHLFCLQDPFPLLISRIGDMIQQGAETLLNTGLIDPVNDFVENLPWPLNNIGRPIQRVCWQTTYDPDRCTGGPLTITERNQLAQCEDVSQGLENLCFYARVRQICSNDDMITEYTQLFANGYQTVDAVEAEFNAAFGESFDYMDPTMANLMRAVEVSSFSGPDLSRRQDICSSHAFSSAMTLDMVCIAIHC
jgi:hypothetical protein